MINKNQLAADLLRKYGLASEDTFYGVFLDGKLLDIRDKNGAFFSSLKGAKSNLLSWSNVLWEYKHKLSPPITVDYRDFKYSEQCVARADSEYRITEEYKAAIKELIKDGRIEIKQI